MSKDNKDIREPGYYRVKFHDAWLIREWNGAGWLIPGYSGVADGLDYSEVDPTPINPEPPSEGSGEVGLRSKEEIGLVELKKWIEEQKEVSQQGYIKADDEESRTMYSSENAALGLVIMKIDKLLKQKQ